MNATTLTTATQTARVVSRTRPGVLTVVFVKGQLPCETGYRVAWEGRREAFYHEGLLNTPVAWAEGGEVRAVQATVAAVA